MKAKLKKTYNYLLRFAIILATYTFLYQQIFIKKNLEEVVLLFMELVRSPNFVIGILFVFALMLLNWSIETWKWQFQISKLEKVSFFKSYQAILTGISVSAFLPNRVGDYFGRVFTLEKANHIEGILITIIGSISQFIATIFLGSIALIFFFPVFTDTSEYFYGYFYPALVTVILVANFLLILFYFNISILSNLIKKVTKKNWEKLRDHMKAFSCFNRLELLKILLISISRYLVFSFQFYLLLRLFSVEIPISYALILIPVVYLAITAIPTVALSEIGVRGSVSIYLIGLYFSKISQDSVSAEVGIFAAASILWLINIVLPAVAGTIFVFKLKFFRKGKS
jgi:Lysylphosphatidylglycerol synthase TM region